MGASHVSPSPHALAIPSLNNLFVWVGSEVVIAPCTTIGVDVPPGQGVGPVGDAWGVTVRVEVATGAVAVAVAGVPDGHPPPTGVKLSLSPVLIMPATLHTYWVNSAAPFCTPTVALVLP